MSSENPQKTVVIGAGPVGALAALYAANRGDEVQVYELRGGEFDQLFNFLRFPKKVKKRLFIILYMSIFCLINQISETRLQSHSTSPSPSTWLSPNEVSTP
jgi:hypothetical protein